MDSEQQARFSARIGVLEVMVSWMVANLAMLTSEYPPEVIATTRTILCEMGPQCPPGLAEDDPGAQAFRAEWERRLDLLLDNAATLVRNLKEGR